MKKITIAIDGYSSCGKSTMAKDLAREIGYVYIDTGAMYRAVTLYALQHKLISEAGIDSDRLQGQMPHIQIGFKLNAESRPEPYLIGGCGARELRPYWKTCWSATVSIPPAPSDPCVRQMTRWCWTTVL